MKPKPLDVLKVKYGELFRYLAEQEQTMTSAEQLYLVRGEVFDGLHGMLIFYADPVAYFMDEHAVMEPLLKSLDIREVKYGELFRYLAEQKQAMTSAEQLFLVQGEVYPELHGMLIFYAPVISRQCDPPVREEPT